MARTIGLMLGLGFLLLTLLTSPPEGMSEAAWVTAGVGLLMASWWATEAIPVPMTSLLPIVLFPMLGLINLKGATAPYAHPVIYLLMGGFIIATALQRWNLHRRLALTILRQVGNHPYAIIGGFMGISAFLSMWISNTATTIMMIPIALSMASVLIGGDKKEDNFTICLILGIAYSASIGGLGTLVGTPPNAMVAAYMSETYNVEIGFLQWMLLGVPVVLVLVPLAWWLLTRLAFKFEVQHNSNVGDVVRDELDGMGNITVPEKRTAIVFLCVALAWVIRPLLQKLPGLGGLSDVIIAVGGAIAMFMVPSGCANEKGTRLLDWNTAAQIPWGILLLFGGGLSLANMVSDSGLAQWLGDALAALTTFHMLILIFALVTLVIFLTELTSNTATTATLLPVMGSIAAVAGLDPMLLTAPMALAASCAFMLPVATAPNAIVFATDRVSIPQMARAGVWVNVAGIVVISVLAYLLVPRLLVG
ncbi:DASS family sodium-coupled anion symporter [Porticoccus sp. W117]|uniref:SLC13 family permease n=1 Tax=Porticoccus sp. W117 TaxID=3054777 RepID=UPI002597C720|nr:DASS family sodium-coupled anion symporter [Porticoccus sp. W117]MDM3870827.1 DASS family sodium-coupled anion symporter [Porticoccus sp. W117]